MLFRTPGLFDQFPELIAAESTRHGGVSPVPFASLNLGINTPDDPANVDENRRRFFAAIGAHAFSFASAHQVHGIAVLTATEPGRFDGYDAFVTNVPNLLIGVTVADCVPILIYDPTNRAVGAAHAGWRGTVGNIVGETLTTMNRQFGTNPQHCFAYVGTCIDECSFEVGPEVAEQFETSVKRMDEKTGKGFVDLKAANRDRLIAAGVPANQIDVSAFSTVLHNDDYFSHRAEHGQTGRMLTVVGVRNESSH